MWKKPKYLDQVINLASSLNLDHGVTNIAVLHDNWCPMLNHSGPCSCNPEVRPIGFGKDN